MKFSKELIKGSTKKLILAILAEGDLHGYHIIREIKRKSGEALEFGEGSIYPALHALEKEKLIEGYWEQQDGGHERKYYRITPKGRRALKSAVREWKEFTHAVNKALKGML